MHTTAQDGTGLHFDLHPAPRSHSGAPALLVHGFGSSGTANWVTTGWIRVLGQAGIDTVTVDLRGHGRSGHPSDPSAYTLGILLDDLERVLTASVGTAGGVDLVGYSLGGRLVAELAPRLGSTLRRAVVGGQDGRPLFQGVSTPALAQFLGGASRTLPDDAATARIAAIATATPDSDRVALGALVSGLVADPAAARRCALPAVPVLVAAGSRDILADGARRWAAASPRARFLEIPGRTHISAVTAHAFRQGAAAFLAR